MNRLM